MEEIFNELCSCLKDEYSAFSFFCSEDLKKISRFFGCKTVAARETLWKEGDPCDYVAFIVSGRVEIKKETDFGEKQVIIGVYSKGTFVGELCILDDGPRAVTAVALEDVSLVFITRDNFDELIDKYPELGVQLLKGILLSISKRLRKSFDRLISIF